MAFFLLAPAGAAQAAVRVAGLNDWLAAAAERSLGAVYDHIPAGESPATKEQLLRVVADRLLSGYAVRSVVFEAETVVSIELEALAPAPFWEVALISPNLSDPVDRWFAADVAGLAEEIAGLLADVPVEALAWGDLDLRDRIAALSGERLPGWRVSLMVRAAADDRMTLEVVFSPEQPLTLAVTTRINSSSIPVMLHSSLRDDLLRGFAPVIGIPVPWLDRHKEDLVAMSKQILREETLVERAKAEPQIVASTGTVSELDIELESRRYAVWVWMAVYAGTEDRYPEMGLHFGRRAMIISGWEMELYGELIMAMDDWDLETRLGMRWSPWKSVWFGAEWSSRDDLWWLRASTEARIRRPYVWVRQSQEGDTNAALGLRLNDFLSIEVHYDSRDEDEWNVRALVNL